MTILITKNLVGGPSGPASSTKLYMSTSTVHGKLGPLRSMASSIGTAVSTLDREQIILRIRDLEAAAAEAHKAAQELNKQGKYQEAAEMYATMRELDAEALDATQELGCPSCRVSAADRAAARDMTAESRTISPTYLKLHSPSPWLASSGV